MTIAKLKQKLRKPDYADAIISAVLDIPRTQFSNTDEISPENAKLCMEVARVGRDLAYKRGHWRFMDLPLTITKDVIVPAFDSEDLVKSVIDTKPDSVLDIGTGCGAIAIAIAKSTKAKVIATDICSKILYIAKKNAKMNKVAVEFWQSDMFKQVTGRFNLIVSNPPASPSGKLDELETKGKLAMPRASRDGGEDGLKFIREIIINAKDYLTENGLLALQASYAPDTIKELLVANDFEIIELGRGARIALARLARKTNVLLLN